MGLLDNLLYNASPDNGPGILGYLNNDRTAHVEDDGAKSTSANNLALALGLTGQNLDPSNPGMVNAPSTAPAAGAPGAPSVPISTSNYTPPAAPVMAPAAAPMTSPVTAPQFGANASPYLFPQSSQLFGANPPAPAAISPAVANANAQDDDDDDAPAPNAPASPIAVGGVNMPRIGPAAAFTPPAASPAAAAPAPVAPADASPLDAIGNHAKAAWQSMRNGGGLIGGLSAAVTGQRDDPMATYQATQSAQANLTAKALLAHGVDPATVAAAVQPGGSKILESLLPMLSPQSYTQETDKDGNVYNVNKVTNQKTMLYQPKDDKFTSSERKNADGSTTPVAFNTKTGDYKFPEGSAPGAGVSSVDPALTGKDRMDALMAANPNYARRVQSAVNGDIPLPTSGPASRSPAAAKFTEDVLAVDGSTSASDFTTRAATRKDYASGMASRVTKSLNTTIEHAQRLDDAIDKLGNHTYFPGVANWVHDKIGSNTDPKYQTAKSEFESAKEAFIKELDFTLSGGHSSVSGSAELRDKINRADSPEAMHAAIQTDLHLLAARLDSHTTGFNQGTKSQRDPQDFLYPKNRASFNKLMGSADTSTGGAVPGVDSAPATAAPAAPGAAPVASGTPVTGKLGPGNYAWNGNNLVKN